MRILFLGPKREHLINYLLTTGDEVLSWEGPLKKGFPIMKSINFIISYGYRYLLSKEIINSFQKRAINLHISLLPWNRGADPTLWSFLDNTPKGVTIHYMNYGVDTGDILIQQEIELCGDETLKSSYDKLSKTIESLFKEKWLLIRNQKIKGRPQEGKGSFHLSKDRSKVEHLLIKGWETPIQYLIERKL